MIIEYTENADLDFGTKDFDKLVKGIVIFPENLEEASMFEQNITTIEDLIDKLIEFQNREL